MTKRTEDQQLVHLGQCWEAFMQGRSVNKDDAEAMIADLADYCGYYTAANIGTPSENLHYREGQRSLFARIILLSRVPKAVQDRVSRMATEDLIFDDPI